MNLSTYQQSAKKKINNELTHFFSSQIKSHTAKETPRQEVFRQLHEFSLKGKHIRGILVLAGHEAYSENHRVSITNIAAAMDLAQSALLIHDDVMDRDEMRRGEASVWGIYKKYYVELGVSLSEKIAADAAICVGDIGFYLAFELFATNTALPHFQDAFALFCREMTLVGIGQLRDVESPYIKDLSLKNIDEVYRFKTARYTFSLPLMLGATIVGADKSQIKMLEDFGELVGMNFQLADDRLSLFGDIEKTGKPIGHDIAENKNTYYKYYLFQRADAKDRKILKTLFGSGTLTLDQITVVRDMVKKYKIDSIIQQKIEDQQKKALRILDMSKMKDEFKNLLKDLVVYVSNRDV